MSSKKSIFLVLALGLLASTQVLSAETIRLGLPLPEGADRKTACGIYKTDVLEKLKAYAEANHVDGRYTVIVETVTCNQGGWPPPPRVPCGCTLTATLQDSSYGLSIKEDRVTKTANAEKREAKLKTLAAEVQGRDGYLWDNTSKTFLAFIWKGYSILSIYVYKK